MRRQLRPVLLCLGLAVIVAIGVLPTAAEDTYWHIKAVHPKGYLLDIKAVDAKGKTYDIKAIEHEGNPHMLDVKAIVNGGIEPVKVVVSDDRYAPVKAIDVNGRNIDLKALTPKGNWLEVKGVRRTGNIIHIKAIGVGKMLGVKAISPDGRMYDVKGIKMVNQRTESLLGSIEVHAHVKAIPPAAEP